MFARAFSLALLLICILNQCVRPVARCGSLTLQNRFVSLSVFLTQEYFIVSMLCLHFSHMHNDTHARTLTSQLHVCSNYMGIPFYPFPASQSCVLLWEHSVSARVCVWAAAAPTFLHFSRCSERKNVHSVTVQNSHTSNRLSIMRELNKLVCQSHSMSDPYWTLGFALSQSRLSVAKHIPFTYLLWRSECVRAFCALVSKLHRLQSSARS